MCVVVVGVGPELITGVTGGFSAEAGTDAGVTDLDGSFNLCPTTIRSLFRLLAARRARTLVPCERAML